MEQEFDTLKLDNQLCFPLYVCAKEIVRMYTPLLEQLGLTYTQYITMMVLWQHNALNAKQIGQILFLDSGTLTPVLKRLEEKGWITRCRAKEDERNLWVCLTPEGEAVKEKAKEIPAIIAQKIAMSKEEAAMLHDLLLRFMAQIR